MSDKPDGREAMRLAFFQRQNDDILAPTPKSLEERRSSVIWAARLWMDVDAKYGAAAMVTADARICLRNALLELGQEGSNV